MKKFYEHIVDHPKIIIALFAACFFVCLILKQFVAVDYDITDYLPDNSPSSAALEEMDAEFDGGIPNARVMIHDVTIPQALEYKAKLLLVDGVTDVIWLDNTLDITKPLEIQDKDAAEANYKDGNALFTVTIENEKIITAVSEIQTIIGDDNAMTGNAVSTAVATTSTVAEISRIAVIGVLFALLVLILTTTSWAEPFIILVGIGIAVIINAGSNLMFGTISFVTNASGNILQLAVSLDYSVFLLHRFAEYRKETADAKEAMVAALTISTSSILSSGLTTVIGFLALCLMQFKIGPDLGLALAKGIAISLITVFIFMPVFLLSTYRLIDRTRHRSFMPDFHGFGRLVSRIMFPITGLFALLIVPSYLASNANQFYYGASHLFGANTSFGADTNAIEDVFGKSDTYVLMVPKTSTALQADLSDELHQIPEVLSILSYVDTVGAEIPEQYLDDGTLSALNSGKYTRMVLTVDADYEGAETFSLVERIRQTADTYYPNTWYLAGEGVSTYDLMDTITKDMVSVNLVAVGAVFFVLAVTMKSLLIPLLLVLGIETAIWINMSVPYFQGSTIFYLAYLIISSIQLGATVDYAILLTQRYQEIRLTTNKKTAVINTLSAVTVSILTSGSTLTVVGFLMGYISSNGLISQLGFFLGKGTLCSLVIVLFVLPGLLYLFDGFFMHRTKPRTRQKNSDQL